ncbi:GIY-YIG nuclease family protein [Polaribacter pectinis]|uniref:GIY-YIG nuclease family protein n=1 Tax=Polaribacter pectinis TaxID=2738844 RepID=A0A7G9L7I4_9FLAO|nr:GIY-YIG nuclease family protein [Polaribacter pectinis]QNM84583.1 GIY-YIG nuclease family protein [Polaribacter pectinis]
MKELENKLQELSNIWKNIEIHLEESNFFKEIIKRLNDNQQTIANFNQLEITNTFGIYIFYIKPLKNYDFKSLEEDWKKIGLEKGYIKFPQIVKSRFDFHLPIKTSEKYVFYIGKSETLGNRIKEHITHEKNASTYGLKLKDRTFFTSENMSFSYWELPPELKSDHKEINQFLITQIEKKLRGKLNPWIGKQ